MIAVIGGAATGFRSASLVLRLRGELDGPRRRDFKFGRWLDSVYMQRSLID